MTGSDASVPAYCGVVAIGRNEGDRLKRCLSSAGVADPIVYVDSGSSDGSVAWTRSQGFEVVELDTSAGFTAARARNAGFRRIKELAPRLQLVQFVDGDCELAEGWLAAGAALLQQRADAAVVFGRLRERHPERSIYNWLCDREWDGPAGEVKHCGGNAMMRTAALTAAGGYREELIAGEEPELCVRLRRSGWSVWRIDAEMGLHDAAMTRFRQWWLRRVRSGYAFAEGSHLHGASPERHWVWESRRAWLWGFWLPLVCAAAVIIIGPWGLGLLLVYALQLLRRTLQQRGGWRERTRLPLFELLGRFGEAEGQLRFAAHRLFKGRSQIIEYK